MKNLFIVESPGKVKKIQGFLGPDFEVVASFGHVRDLPEKSMGISPPEFKPLYEATDRGQSVLKKLSAAAQTADTVYLATDPDREGEAIAWHIADALKLVNPQRVTYTEITEAAVKAALGKARLIDNSLVAAQEGRRVLDRFVGYLVSPKLSYHTGERLSAGRVQSPAVRLVVEREREIRNFTVTVHYGVELVFDEVGNITEGWKANWIPKFGWLEEGQEYILDKSVAEKVATLRSLQVVDYQESTCKSAPPASFITSTLQQAASVALKINPKKTMELAQKLYEGGHITYMRTDSPNLSNEAIAAIRSWAAQHDYPVPAGPRVWKSKAGAQEAHEAIRPTHIEVEEAGETETERSLYKLIRLRAIASQLEDAVFAVRIATLESDVDGKPAHFEAKGRTLASPGWKALVAADQTEETEPEPDNKVPKLEPGRTATARESSLLTKKTKPPARFTEASLIRDLEKRGIGRPSTYASILDNIITFRNYIQVEKRQLAPTVKGEKLIDILSGRFQFLDYAYTSNAEQQFDEIAAGKSDYKTLVADAYRQITDELTAFVEATSPKCPDCGRYLRHVVKQDESGHDAYNFWSCSGYSEGLCQSAFVDQDGKPGAKKETKAAQTVSEFTCPKCGKGLIHKQGKGKKGQYDFFSCSGWPKCDSSFPTKNGQPDFDKTQKPKKKLT
jgi:DNA topoisomerase-1